MPTTPRKPPWYAERDHWMTEGLRYIRAYSRLPDDAPHHAEFRAFDDLCAMRLVFESNLIENAGLSEGDTQKVIAQYFPKVPSTYDALRSLRRSSPIPSGSEVWQTMRQGKRPDLIPSYQFENKSRSVREVLRHHVAYLECKRLSAGYESVLRELALTAGEPRTHDLFLRADHVGLTAAIHAEFGASSPSLITEGAIKRLHADIAEDLIPADAGVKAGEYRIDARSVGLDVGFPAPELVPDAMKAFEQRAQQALVSPRHPISKAAEITYDFLMIHPFPDFNGRVSRLLLAMILFVEGVPFSVTLKGDKKWKARYLYALRRANRGDMRAYEALIARRTVESFQEIDRNLATAGLPGLLTFAPA